MQKLEDTDNITKNIVQEIVRKCMNMKLDANKNFCVYFVKLLTLDPKWKISAERKLNRNNIERIVDFVIDKLCQTNCYYIATLKMQHVYLSNNFTTSEIQNYYDMQVLKILHPLWEEIAAVKPNVLSHAAITAAYFRKICVFITLLSDMGNPQHMTVLKEVLCAFKSAVSDKELIDFTKLKKKEKMDTVNFWTSLTNGIRLFNRECGRPSAEIDDLPSYLKETLNILQMELTNDLRFVMEDVNLATSAIDNFFSLKYHRENRLSKDAKDRFLIFYELVPQYSEEITPKDVNKVKDILILGRQREVYIRQMLHTLDICEQSVNDLIRMFNEVMIRMHNVVKFNIVLSTKIVFPLFLEISDIWRAFQGKSLVLRHYMKMSAKMKSLMYDLSFDSKKLMKMLGNGALLTDAVRLEMNKTVKIKPYFTKCKIIPYEEYDKTIPLEYSGYCLWTLVETEGGLIPGNPYMGIALWRHKYYAFANAEAAIGFGIDPDRVLVLALLIVRERPQLINLLHLYKYLFVKRNDLISAQKIEELFTHSEVSIQTEVHPIESNIDSNYVWNIWDHYKTAQKTAKNMDCLTKSTQEGSLFRRTATTQTVQQRTQSCQTKIDHYTNTATVSNYFYGLRAKKENVAHIIDLTRPYDEKLYYENAKANFKNLIYRTACKKEELKEGYTGHTKKIQSASSDSKISKYSIHNRYSLNSIWLNECYCSTGSLKQDLIM